MSIPCKGNGMTLGVTEGTNNGGFINSSEGAGIVARKDIYGKETGSSNTSASTLNTWKSIGVSTDPTKSGVVADLSDGQIVVIKY